MKRKSSKAFPFFCKAVLFIVYTCFAIYGKTQVKKELRFTTADSLGLSGKIMPTKQPFHRVDSLQAVGLPAYTLQLLRHGSGLAVAFKTNSKVIAARWCTTKSKASAYLSPAVQKGVDLNIKREGRWQFAGVGKPEGECSEAVLVQNMEEGEKECLLYLPLYNETTRLAIGVEQQASLSALADPFRKRILVYGSSIVQGASASRPGMAYPARMTRNTGLNFLNLGLSGSAKMEKEAAALVASINADAFILDCVPNTSPALIKERAAYLIKKIRDQHPEAPIIVVQSIKREHGHWNGEVGRMVDAQNRGIQQEVQALLKAGMKDLYFITSDDMLGADHEGTVDGTHPNDLGFDRMIGILQPQVLAILKKYGIEPEAEEK